MSFLLIALSSLNLSALSLKDYFITRQILSTIPKHLSKNGDIRSLERLDEEANNLADEGFKDFLKQLISATKLLQARGFREEVSSEFDFILENGKLERLLSDLPINQYDNINTRTNDIKEIIKEKRAFLSRVEFSAITRSYRTPIQTDLPKAQTVLGTRATATPYPLITTPWIDNLKHLINSIKIYADEQVKLEKNKQFQPEAGRKFKAQRLEYSDDTLFMWNIINFASKILGTEDDPTLIQNALDLVSYENITKQKNLPEKIDKPFAKKTINELHQTLKEIANSRELSQLHVASESGYEDDTESTEAFMTDFEEYKTTRSKVGTTEIPRPPISSESEYYEDETTEYETRNIIGLKSIRLHSD